MLPRWPSIRLSLFLASVLLNACSGKSSKPAPAAAEERPAEPAKPSNPDNNGSSDQPNAPIKDPQAPPVDPSGAFYQTTWRSGSQYANEANSLAANEQLQLPDRRDQAQSWTDQSGRRWLFGGRQDSLYLGDLWFFEAKTLTWTALPLDGAEHPAARAGALTWVDAAGRLHLAGGEAQGLEHRELRADHWRFDPEHKTWERLVDTDSDYLRVHAALVLRPGQTSYLFGGYRLMDNGAVHYLRDVWTLSADGSHWERLADAGQGPSARSAANIWVDGSGLIWIYAGYGYDAEGSEGHLDDLWSLTADGKTWQLVSGSPMIEQCRRDVPLEIKITSPMARAGATSWTDASGQLWIFGGERHLPCGSLILLNDLWKFDPTQKTWSLMRRHSEDPHGRYEGGAIGSRSFASTWYDATLNRLWIFGGFGYATDLLAGHLRDLWTLDREKGP